eukprot:764574-Hanusia_phi.AAC.2
MGRTQDRIIKVRTLDHHVGHLSRLSPSRGPALEPTGASEADASSEEHGDAEQLGVSDCRAADKRDAPGASLLSVRSTPLTLEHSQGVQTLPSFVKDFDFWTETEHMKFLAAMKSTFKLDLATVALLIGSRTSSQVDSHYKLYMVMFSPWACMDRFVPV